MMAGAQATASTKWARPRGPDCFSANPLYTFA
jgi:hypothetical protein